MPTATKLTPVEVRDRLEVLLKAATEYAAAEAKVQRLAAELEEHEDDWTEELPRFESAVHHEIKQALYDATTTDNIDALDRCQSIQDAIDVLNFAVERDDDVR